MIKILTLLSQIKVDPGELDIPQTAPTSDGTVATALEILFAVLGSIAFLVIVLAGLRYTISRGNADSLTKARNAIIYAAVGLVLSMLAFSIVRFVVRNI
jgi:Type IV secretion system pilin